MCKHTHTHTSTWYCLSEDREIAEHRGEESLNKRGKVRTGRSQWEKVWRSSLHPMPLGQTLWPLLPPPPLGSGVCVKPAMDCARAMTFHNELPWGLYQMVSLPQKSVCRTQVLGLCCPSSNISTLSHNADAPVNINTLFHHADTLLTSTRSLTMRTPC